MIRNRVGCEVSLYILHRCFQFFTSTNYSVTRSENDTIHPFINYIHKASVVLNIEELVDWFIDWRQISITVN